MCSDSPVRTCSGPDPLANRRGRSDPWPGASVLGSKCMIPPRVPRSDCGRPGRSVGFGLGRRRLALLVLDLVFDFVGDAPFGPRGARGTGARRFVPLHCRGRARSWPRSVRFGSCVFPRTTALGRPLPAGRRRAGQCMTTGGMPSSSRRWVSSCFRGRNMAGITVSRTIDQATQ